MKSTLEELWYGNISPETVRSLRRNSESTSVQRTNTPEIGPVSAADEFSDLSPYYLVKKDNAKLLVNVKNYVMEVVELASNTNEKRFVYGKNKFTNCGKLKINTK